MRLAGRLFLMGMILLVSGAASPQMRQVQVEAGANVRVSEGGVPHAEPHIAAHPENPRNLIVTAAHTISGQECLVETFATSDGGQTWLVSPLPELEGALARKEMSLASNPWVAYAPDGTAYCSTLAAMKRGHAWGRLPVLVYRSRDQGARWEGPAVVGPFFDRPAPVAAGRGKDARLFVAAMGISAPSEPAGVAVLRSDDNAMTFQRTLITPDNLGHNAGSPAVSPEGALVVPYADFPSSSREQFERRRSLMHASRIYVVTSRDQGRTFGLPQFVADIPRLAPGFPEMAVDLSSGRFRGRLYLAWSGETEERQNVTVAWSGDRGESWSTTTMKAASSGAAHYPAVAVSQDGILGVAWLQEEPQPSRRPCWRTCFAASVDGGQSFSEPAAVSEVVSCPDPIANQSVISRFERGAHYIGLAAADGTFHPAWPDSRDGAFQIYTAPVKVRVE